MALSTILWGTPSGYAVPSTVTGVGVRRDSYEAAPIAFLDKRMALTAREIFQLVDGQKQYKHYKGHYGKCNSGHYNMGSGHLRRIALLQLLLHLLQKILTEAVLMQPIP